VLSSEARHSSGLANRPQPSLAASPWGRDRWAGKAQSAQRPRGKTCTGLGGHWRDPATVEQPAPRAGHLGFPAPAVSISPPRPFRPILEPRKGGP